MIHINHREGCGSFQREIIRTYELRVIGFSCPAIGERINRTIKDATVKRCQHNRHDQLRGHLADAINAYISPRCLRTLSELTPYECT